MIPREKLLELYAAMMKCRMLTERAGLPKTAPRWEAAYAAVALNLQSRDTAIGDPRVRAARGASLVSALTAMSRKPARRVVDPLAAACDAARKHKAAKSTRLAAVFCGEAQVSAAQWKKALTLAGRRSLPVIFVSLRTEGRAPAFVPSTEKPEALAFDVPLITVDGADLVAIYRVVSESTTRARQRRIPTLIDCVLAPGADPVAVMETWLAARGHFSPALRRKNRAAIARELHLASASPIR